MNVKKRQRVSYLKRSLNFIIVVNVRMGTLNYLIVSEHFFILKILTARSNHNFGFVYLIESKKKKKKHHFHPSTINLMAYNDTDDTRLTH